MGNQTVNEYQAKTLELIGFNRIVSEAQAYQISRNLIKAFKNTPDLNKLTAPSYVVHLLNKIKVGSYFKYKKNPTKLIVRLFCLTT